MQTSSVEIPDMIDDVLRYLCHAYQSQSSSIVNIAEITNKFGLDAHVIGKLLLAEEFVDHHTFSPDGFYCSVTITGMIVALYGYIQHATDYIVLGLGFNENYQSLSKILGYSAEQFEIVKYFANRLQHDLIEADFRNDDVFARLTMQGKEHLMKLRPLF